MRARQRRRSRSPVPLDLRTLYVEGFASGVLHPIERPAPSTVDFEVGFCEEILKGFPDHVEALALLGEACSRRGEYARGLAADLRLSQIRPESAYVRYNLACSYALNEQGEESLRALTRAVELGYRDADHMRTDRDLALLRNDPRFVALIEKIAAARQEAGPV